MADRIEVTKTIEFVAIGSPANSIAASKVVAFALLTPGDGGTETQTRVSHVYAQKLRRR